MKKVVYVIILILFIGIAIGSKILLENAKSNNIKMEKNISENKKKEKDTISKKEELEKELEEKKEEVKDKIEEYEIWEKAKNKLNEAL
jgi:beta-lactam-binding protein with PASTA domain